MNFFHNTQKVTHVGGVKMPDSPLIEFRGTLEECLVERDRLNLKDPRGLLGEVIELITNTMTARALFLSQPNEVKAQFGEIFRVISSLRVDEDKALLIEALAVPVELQPIQAQLVAILRS